MATISMGISLMEGAYPGWFGAGKDVLAALDEHIIKYNYTPALFSLWSSWRDAGKAPRGKEFPDLMLMIEIDQRGITPLIFWEPDLENNANSLARIAAGEYDDYIVQWAKDAAMYGKTVIVRFAHEMNGNWFPWSPNLNGNSTTTYVKAWKHVVATVRDIAPNVKFLWCPNARDAKGSAPLEDFWPGDEFVQFVGVDGYKWNNDGYGSYIATFDRPIERIRALSQRQIILAEHGIGSGGTLEDRSQHLNSLKALADKWLKLKAAVYFDIDMSQINGHPNWRLSAKPSLDNKYRAMVSYDSQRRTLTL
jgi:beta-mannanase